MAEDGKPWTPGAVDFFRIVNEQLIVVEDIKNGVMIIRTGEVILQVMREFQVCILQSQSRLCKIDTVPVNIQSGHQAFQTGAAQVTRQTPPPPHPPPPPALLPGPAATEKPPCLGLARFPLFTPPFSPMRHH